VTKTTEAGETRKFVWSDNSFDVLADDVEMEDTNVNGHVSASDGTIAKGHASAYQSEMDAETLATSPKWPMKKKPKNTWFGMSEAYDDKDEIITKAIENDSARNNNFRNTSSTKVITSVNKKEKGYYINGNMNFSTRNREADKNGESYLSPQFLNSNNKNMNNSNNKKGIE
jgi:hypothetical protein